MELTVENRVFPLLPNVLTDLLYIVVDGRVCYFAFDMYIVHSGFDLVSINVTIVTSYFPSTRTVSECQLCG